MNDPRFNNRRKMAWISFIFIIFVGGGLVIYGSMVDEASIRIERISFIIGTVFGVLTTIVVSYFTSTTVTDVNDLRFKQDVPERPNYAPSHTPPQYTITPPQDAHMGADEQVK